MRSFLGAALVLLVASTLQSAESPPAESSGIESLGNELLEGLVPGQFDRPLSRPANRPGDRQLPGARAPRFDDLGEDIGRPSGSLSLERVRAGMQHAQDLLAASDAAPKPPTSEQVDVAQQEVINQLDKLIAELSKQCQGGQCNSPGEPKPNQNAKKKPGKPSSAAGRGQTAAHDSTDRLNAASAKPVEKGDVEAMVKELWGHLPERSREQMMQSFSEEFLPKYELEIEQYYRRLSEENGAARGQ